MNDSRDNQDEPRVPARLVEALRRADAPTTSVPPAVDRALGARARMVAGSRGSPRTRLLRIAAVTAAAAALLLFFVPLGSAPGPAGDGQREGAVTASNRREDVDASGRVDVLDAFLLARALRDGRDAPEFDVDGSGTFDGRDVDLVARAAVSLERGR